MLMFNYIRQWYLSLFNPAPVPKQIWNLDSVGLVEIVQADYCEVIYKDISESETYSAKYYHFISQAELWQRVHQPSLVDSKMYTKKHKNLSQKKLLAGAVSLIQDPPENSIY